MKILRHVFTPKAPDVARYGHPAPRDGYINSFTEEVDEPVIQEEWDELDQWLAQEEEQARAELAAWFDPGNAFRSRFLNWAEPRGLETPTTAGDLESWVERYVAETGDKAGMAEYLEREATP